jgi:hypothetical protein
MKNDFKYIKGDNETQVLTLTRKSAVSAPQNQSDADSFL